MKEEMHAGRHRIGVRGNIFSFLMPWKDIMDSLRRVEHTTELLVPHPPEVLAHAVRLHMTRGGEHAEVFKFIKEIQVCTQVILEQGKELIENHHPAFTKKGTHGTRVLKADAVELCRRLRLGVRSTIQHPKTTRSKLWSRSCGGHEDR